MMSIIINTATVSSTSVVFNEIQNIASITTSVVAKIDTIDTENTDVSTFSKLEEISVASENVAETIEDSGSSTTIDVDSAINDASGSVDTDNLFEPTRAEKGIRKLKQPNIADSIINDISAISLDLSGDTVIGSHLDYDSIDTSANVRIARSAVMDILFGNDPSAVSFITTKEDIGILIDHTGYSNTINAKDFNLSTVRVYAPKQVVVIDDIVSKDEGVYCAITQTGDEITLIKYGRELHFILTSTGEIIMTDNRVSRIINQGDILATSLGTIIYGDGLFTDCLLYTSDAADE